jgi:hypothetical protein
MSTRALDTEPICWAAIDRLQAELPAALAEVAAFRTRTPLALPDPVEITFGFDEGALDRSEADYPYVMVVGAPRMPDQPATDRVAQAVHTLVIDWVVCSPIRLHAKLMATRYGEAILAVILKHSYVGWAPQHAAPQVDDEQAVWVGLDKTRASDKVYLCGGTVSVPLKGRVVR